MFNKVLISLTNQCQNSCFHCTNQNFRNVPDGVNLNLIKEASHLFDKNIEVGFCGGEPLIRFHLMEEIVNFFEENFNPRFYIFTNGILLTEERIQYFKSHKIKTYVSLNGPAMINLRTRPSKSQTYYLPKIIDNYFALKEQAPEICGISSVLFKDFFELTPLILDWIKEMNPTFWEYFLDCDAPLRNEDLPNLQKTMKKIENFNEKTTIIIEPLEIIKEGKVHQSDTTPLYIRGNGTFEIPIWGRSWDAKLAKDHLLGDITKLEANFKKFTKKYGPIYSHPITKMSEKCNGCKLFFECLKPLTDEGKRILDNASEENCILLGGYQYDDPDR